jgi:hypothetical protein
MCTRTVGSSVLERTDRLNSIKVNSAAVGAPAAPSWRTSRRQLAKDHHCPPVSPSNTSAMPRTRAMPSAAGHCARARHHPRVPHHGGPLRKRGLSLRGALLHSRGAHRRVARTGLTMQPLSIFAIVGLIMLSGPGEQERYPHRGLRQPPARKEGMGLTEALLEAGRNACARS